MALAAFRRPRPDTDQPADDRPADLVAAENRLAELRRQRAEKQQALRDLQVQFEGEAPPTIVRLVEAEVAALNDAVAAARAEVAPLREANAQAEVASRRIVSPARRAADAVEKSARLLKLENRLVELKARKRDIEHRLVGAKRSEADPIRAGLAELNRLIAVTLADLGTQRAEDAAAVALALAPLRRDAGHRLLAALAEIESALVELAEVDEAGVRRRVDPSFPPSAADPFLSHCRAAAARAAR